jgi:hypothetical protein
VKLCGDDICGRRKTSLGCFGLSLGICYVVMIDTLAKLFDSQGALMICMRSCGLIFPDCPISQSVSHQLNLISQLTD